MAFQMEHAVAIGTVAVSAAAVWIKALSNRPPSTNGYVKKGEFQECVKRLEVQMAGLGTSISEVKSDVRGILNKLME